MTERPRTFAIDYDGTWTADPEAFRAIVSLLRRRGHRVIVVTARAGGHGIGEVHLHCEAYVDRILATHGAGKRDYAQRHGETVDIWIDDMPEMIGDSRLIG